MSGFFGIYHRDGRPQDSNTLARMTESIDHRGPDGTKIWQNGVIALGHCMLQTTPESINEKLPYADHETGLVITCDARIDNREELAQQLGLAERLKTGIPDSLLILAAYKKWNENCVNYLLGDFAFAIWDEQQQRLFCTRDIFGVKPFYYHLSENNFIFGSEIRQIAEHPLVSLSLNEGVLAEYLADYFITKDETHFSDIKRLPAAHYIIINSNQVCIQNYWKLRPQKRIWYKNNNEYIEHFLEIFGEAVRCRLRCNNKIGVYLSGGIDSSAIVGMANHLHNQKIELQTYSLIFPGKNCDETNYINAVNRKWNSRHHNIVYQECQPNWSHHIQTTLEIPDRPNLTMMEPLIKEVASNDVHVMLSGIGGDELFNGSKFEYLDLLLKRDIKNLIEEFKFNAQYGIFKTFVRLTANIFWPIIPEFIREKLLLRKAIPQFPPWVSNSIIKLMEERNHTIKRNTGLEYANLSDRNIFNILTGSSVAKVFELFDRYSSYYQVENRYPFYDRRLIEFALAIPEYERSRQHITKYILRKTGKYLLPDTVISRTDKAEFSTTFVNAIRNTECEDSLLLKKIIQKGYVGDKKLLFEKFNQFFEANSHTKSIEYLWPLWFTFSMNIFLDNLESEIEL